MTARSIFSRNSIKRRVSSITASVWILDYLGLRRHVLQRSTARLCSDLSVVHAAAWLVKYCEQEEPERLVFVPNFIMAFPGVSNELPKGVSEMEQRDWELLDKQLRGHQTLRDDGLIASTVAAVFFAGLILGGPLVPHESELMRSASYDARPVISFANGASSTTWR